jgi:hypothetical protein
MVTYLTINPITAPIPISHDAHQAPRIPAANASKISQIATPPLEVHFAELAPSIPIMNIESPHQNAVKAYNGYQIKLKIPNIASPPIIIKIMLPAVTIKTPKLFEEDCVEVSYNISPPKLKMQHRRL